MTHAMSASARTLSISVVRARSKIWRHSICQKSSRKRLRNDDTFKPFGVLGRARVRDGVDQDGFTDRCGLPAAPEHASDHLRELQLRGRRGLDRDLSFADRVTDRI